MSVVPVAKAIYLCGFHIGYDDGKVDLYGLFNAIRTSNGFPYIADRFCVFVQLINGQGKLPFFIDIRYAADDALIRTTETRELNFPNRFSMIQIALTIEGCLFERPGLYNIELFCDNTWVCDTQVLLHS